MEKLKKLTQNVNKNTLKARKRRANMLPEEIDLANRQTRLWFLSLPKEERVLKVKRSSQLRKEKFHSMTKAQKDIVKEKRRNATEKWKAGMSKEKTEKRAEIHRREQRKYMAQKEFAEFIALVTQLKENLS